MNEFQIFRQQAVETEPHNCMGLPSADLHDRPRPMHCLLDPLCQRLRHRAIAKLIHVFHDRDSKKLAARYRSRDSWRDRQP